MGFVKFEAAEPSRPAVKLSGTTIVVSPAEWSKAGLDGTEYLNLWWDDKTHQIGLSSTDSEDKNKFSTRATKRGVSISAKRFFDKFGIGTAETDGGLRQIGEVIAFKVNLAGTTASASSAPASNGSDAPKRRGRRPKNPV